MIHLGFTGFEGDVIAEHQEARALGARGVGFFVIDRRFGVPGAQAVDVFAQALFRASGA